MSPCGIVVNCKFHRTFPFFNSKWIGQIFLSFVTLESFHFTFSPPEYRTHHLVLLQNTSLGIIGSPPECLSGLTWSTLSGDPIFDIDSSTSVCHFVDTENTQDALRIVLKCQGCKGGNRNCNFNGQNYHSPFVWPKTKIQFQNSCFKIIWILNLVQISYRNNNQRWN